MSVLGIEPTSWLFHIGILDSPLETFVYGLMKILVKTVKNRFLLNFFEFHFVCGGCAAWFTLSRFVDRRVSVPFFLLKIAPEPRPRSCAHILKLSIFHSKSGIRTAQGFHDRAADLTRLGHSN